MKLVISSLEHVVTGNKDLTLKEKKATTCMSRS